MTMRTASKFMTPCEALRRVNDLCQGDSKKEIEARELLAKFEIMAKRMAQEINKRPGRKITDKWWEESVLNWKEMARFRMSDIYKDGTED